jgi:hypothetical protein
MENKTGKYLKYAIGEIVLVVIGILIALQINNWNEHRKIKIEERILLEAVLENLKQDSITIANILITKNRILSVHKNLIDFVNDKKSSDEIEDIGLVRRSLPGLLTLKANHPDLQNQVLDKTTKSAVLSYFQMVNAYEFILGNYNNILEEQLRPFLGDKQLLNFGKQFDGLSQMINKPLFLEELKKPELQQVIFNVGVKLNLITEFSDKWIETNEFLKKTIKDYLQKS